MKVFFQHFYSSFTVLNITFVQQFVIEYSNEKVTFIVLSLLLDLGYLTRVQHVRIVRICISHHLLVVLTHRN